MLLISDCLDKLLSPTKRNLSSFIVYVLSLLRLKGQRADVQEGGKKRPPSQPEETISSHNSAKHTDTHITPPHHINMKASHLPTLLEEETTDLKSPDPVPMVREEADGKDDAAEVYDKNRCTHN